MVIRVIENQQDLELLPSVELLDTGGIYSVMSIKFPKTHRAHKVPVVLLFTW